MEKTGEEHDLESFRKKKYINKRKHCIPEKLTLSYRPKEQGHVGILASGFQKGLAKFWHFIKSREHCEKKHKK